jgi:uncharacterized repeat protein (TIGR03833 family)
MITTVTNRSEIKPGMSVDIILKADQRTGKRTRGIVQEILTNSVFHPHGIKVRLNDGQVGRVAGIISQNVHDTRIDRAGSEKGSKHSHENPD